MSRPDSRRPQAGPPLSLRRPVSIKMRSELLHFRVRVHHPGQRKRPQERTVAFIWFAFPLNSNPLTYSFLLLIKRVGLKWNWRRMKDNFQEKVWLSYRYKNDHMFRNLIYSYALRKAGRYYNRFQGQTQNTTVIWSKGMSGWIENRSKWLFHSGEEVN